MSVLRLEGGDLKLEIGREHSKVFELIEEM
jgi:hypothetical protein